MARAAVWDSMGQQKVKGSSDCCECIVRMQTYFAFFAWDGCVQDPGLNLLFKILATTKNEFGLECQNVNFLKYLGQDAIHFPSCSSGASAAPRTFTLTPASYSHSTNTSQHSICFMTSFLFFSKSKRISWHLNKGHKPQSKQ